MKPMLRREYVLLALGILAATAPVIGAHFAIPHFVEVFSSFGAELPWLTSVVVNFYPALVAFPALVFVVWLLWPEPASRAIVAAIVGGCLSLCLSVLLVVALYLPIFRLGQPI